jgi:hypothetical protein
VRLFEGSGVWEVLWGWGIRFIEDNSLAMRRKDGTFEEDIQCIIEPREGRGGIFISNLEAASNPDTLLSNGSFTQSIASALSSPRPRETTSHHACPPTSSTSIYPPSIVKVLTFRSTLRVRGHCWSRNYRGPMFWCIAWQECRGVPLW